MHARQQSRSQLFGPRNRKHCLVNIWALRNMTRQTSSRTTRIAQPQGPRRLLLSLYDLYCARSWRRSALITKGQREHSSLMELSLPRYIGTSTTTFANARCTFLKFTRPPFRPSSVQQDVKSNANSPNCHDLDGVALRDKVVGNGHQYRLHDLMVQQKTARSYYWRQDVPA